MIPYTHSSPACTAYKDSPGWPGWSPHRTGSSYVSQSVRRQPYGQACYQPLCKGCSVWNCNISLSHPTGVHHPYVPNGWIWEDYPTRSEKPQKSAVYLAICTS